MDNWKLGENGREEEGGLFKEDDLKNGFSIGKTDEEEPAKSIFKQKKTEKEIPPKKEKKSNKENKGGIKKIFYVLLGIAALFSAYYLVKIILPANGTNIRLFAMKSFVYRSQALPENNLVISGYLVNNNKFPVSYVKLSCKIYSVKNIVLLTKHVYAGNYISAKKLKNMTNVDIDMALDNKEGRNMSNVEILPDRPIKFMIVFFDINQNTKNYSIAISHFYRIKK